MKSVVLELVQLKKMFVADFFSQNLSVENSNYLEKLDFVENKKNNLANQSEISHTLNS